MIGRQNIPKVLYNNKDITQDLARFLESISYNDPLSDKADDLTLTVDNSLKLWNNDWLPEKGAMLEVSLISKMDNKEEVYPLGKFEIDEFEVSGTPSVAQIKAVSIPDNAMLRGVDKNKSWEKYTLSQIAQDIANIAKMELIYSADTNPVIERAEVTEESYLAFLQKLCIDNGMALKVSNMKLIIFEEYKYEQQEPTAEIDFSVQRVISYRFTSKLRDTYKSCHIKYTDTNTGQTYEGTFTDENKQTGQTLEINKQVISIADAERLAKQELRNTNKDELTADIEIETAVFYYAGQTINIKNMGAFSGKYIITNVSYDISSGMNVKLTIRRCLNGY